jgi:hypothetical protein
MKWNYFWICFVGSFFMAISTVISSQETDLPIPDFPNSIQMTVRQSSGEVEFEFYTEKLSEGSKQKVPVAVSLVGVYLPGKNRFWEIQARSNEDAVIRVKYGIIPAGFIQRAPENSSAPPLQNGQAYSVTARSREGMVFSSFRYEGK